MLVRIDIDHVYATRRTIRKEVQDMKETMIFDYVGDDNFYGCVIKILQRDGRFFLCKVGFNGGENEEVEIDSKEKKVLINVFSRKKSQ